ncbi:wd40 repeat-containing protein [Chrysochromulina tobinii]|uniref:Cleavage stimulation factor 50 kDa subunit n=1 Tax=Chrysochromulina tobinii TaxID=1460289 RepID=A0A0M0JMQ8_9EUKA|nr:wd40 repeat-containing protein [Chrysochromulina tobinii]|eukprot:KOO27592.1 wd40 repeat-containing protein [Chrysochromulina sp. CCMP291]
MDRAALYKLVVAQLADDGYHGAAQAVSQATGTPGPSVLSLPSHALHGLLSGSPKVDALAPAVSLLRSPAVAPYRPRMAESVGAHRAVVRFSADGKQLAVGTSDGLVHVLDADALLAGKGSAESAMRRFTDHAAAVNDLDYHPSGKQLVSASDDNNLHFYDVASATAHSVPLRTCTDTHPSAARRVAAFSHDEALVLSADETTGAVVLWSSTTAEPAGRCLGHTRPVFSLAHAPTCAAFVSTDEEGALRVWAPGAVPGR